MKTEEEDVTVRRQKKTAEQMIYFDLAYLHKFYFIIIFSLCLTFWTSSFPKTCHFFSKFQYFLLNIITYRTTGYNEKNHLGSRNESKYYWFKIHIPKEHHSISLHQSFFFHFIIWLTKGKKFKREGKSKKALKSEMIWHDLIFKKIRRRRKKGKSVNVRLCGNL